MYVGPGVGTRVVMSRRRLRWGGSEASLRRLRGWEVVEGRAESSNGLWAVESLVSVRRVSAGAEGGRIGLYSV